MSRRIQSKFLRNIGNSLTKHSPEILTGLGITGMVTSVILAVKATPRALQLIEVETARQNREIIKEAAENGDDNCQQISKLKPMDVIRVTWKCYIPTAITSVTSIACLIGANSVNARRNAVLATAYKLSETAFIDYRDKVVETIGENKEQTIRDKVAEEHLIKNPVSSKEIFITGRGDTLCYDVLSGRYFYSSKSEIEKARNEVNREMVSDMYISLNDFYDLLDLEQTRLGNDLGWNIDQGLLDLYFTSKLSENGVPCLVIDYSVAPKYEYDRYL